MQALGFPTVEAARKHELWLWRTSADGDCFRRWLRKVSPGRAADLAAELLREQQAPHSRAIFFTDVNGTGDDVMVYTRLDAETLARAYQKRGVTFGEHYEVPLADVNLHIHEPCWLTDTEERNALAFTQ